MAEEGWAPLALAQEEHIERLLAYRECIARYKAELAPLEEERRACEESLTALRARLAADKEALALLAQERAALPPEIRLGQWNPLFWFVACIVSMSMAESVWQIPWHLLWWQFAYRVRAQPTNLVQLAIMAMGAKATTAHGLFILACIAQACLSALVRGFPR